MSITDDPGTASPGDTVWTAFHLRRSRLEPPLRPDAEVCAAMRWLIAPYANRVLTLGVTPELAGMARRVVAVDWSERMLGHVWPGNRADRHGVCGNWLELPFAGRSFSGVLGDGSLSCLTYPDGYARVFDQLAAVLHPGGRVAIRIYATPEPGESLGDVRQALIAGDVSSVHALKWRLANALCGERAAANLPVTLILDAFRRLFPSRREFLDTSGWSGETFAEIEVYEGSTTSYSFPTLRQLETVVPNAFDRMQFVNAGTYPLAERCPLLVLHARG